jgi:hypothetical protein
LHVFSTSEFDRFRELAGCLTGKEQGKSRERENGAASLACATVNDNAIADRAQEKRSSGSGCLRQK